MEAAPTKRKAESDNRRDGDSKRAKVSVPYRHVELINLHSMFVCRVANHALLTMEVGRQEEMGNAAERRRRSAVNKPR
jgi:hypothetical protein